jgi:hydrogenase/urease accessory protein HupE
VRLWALAVLLILIGVVPADAHLVTSGLGPFYDGALHLVFSPDDLLAIVAIALLAGLRGPAHGRVALFTLPAAWTIGTLSRLPVPPDWMGGAKAVLIFVVAGLAAVDLPLPKSAVFVATALIALASGISNGASLPASASAVAGLTVALGVLLALALGLVLVANSRLGRIPARVAASWAAATALLMAGWAIRLAGQSFGPPSL